MLLLGFAGALRRGELAGQEVAIWANPGDRSFCPAAALEAWLAFRQKGPDSTGGASDGERPLFVG